MVSQFLRFQALFKQGLGLLRATAALGAAARHETELAECPRAARGCRADGGLGDAMAKADIHEWIGPYCWP